MLTALNGCQQKNEKVVRLSNGAQVELPARTIAALTGKQLAQGYCAGCHVYPEPTLLDKQTWKNKVLPNMALRLGLGGDGFAKYAGLSSEEIMAVVQAGVYPDEPAIEEEAWQKIVNFYVEEAPDQLPLPKASARKLKVGTELLQEVMPRWQEGKSSSITLVKIDPRHKRIVTGDQFHNLVVYDSELKKADTVFLDSPPVSLVPETAGGFKVLTIGEINPSDRTAGDLYSIQKANASSGFEVRKLLSTLKRPVYVAASDIDQDGLEDLIVCQHGNYTGELSWFRKTKEGGYQQKILKKAAGARKAIVSDFDQDGRQDILALFAQGQEQVVLFLNQGNGRFNEKVVLQFPPVYGSSYLEVVDFDGDGALDILYTNGDNADYSFSLKPYHGIRIFLNDKKNNFKEAYFFQLHGASIAKACDFDQDGDIDIAAIAYFPDYENAPEAGFVYLENTGNFTFQPSVLQHATAGRWLVMDTGDIDQDGDQDIVLGSYTHSPTPVPELLQQQWQQHGAGILLLKNKLKE
ncbi:VCBS repeat-containing protein [Pontibacter sp. SGAir0037]|uniref:FG-GAP repeat domain-containing protein n=1 Tax=Pontibacter sp. SGAir0037 TaxID=2571030 RepID=UPI00143DC35D|nr:VCBS repeat-containing protein [Pontibacter sp. SGAir0037]